MARAGMALAIGCAWTFQAAALTVTTTAGSGQIALSWTAESGATAYKVDHAQVSGGPYATVASGLATTTYTHTGRASGSTNYYVVTATTPGGDVVSPEVSGRWVATRLRAINCGGPAVGAFAADTGFAGGSPFSTTASINLTAVADPAPEAVYQSARTSSATTYIFGPFAKNHSYKVRAHFAEIVYAALTTRGTFNNHIYLNDASANDTGWLNWFNLNNFVAAPKAVNKAYIAEKSITPSLSGQIRFKMDGNGLVNALEVIAYDAPVPDVKAYPRDGKVILDLSTAFDALALTIKRATASGGPYTTVASAFTGVSYVDTGLSNGTTYYYVVAASNAWGVVDSAEQTVIPGIPCYAININGSAAFGRFVAENNTFSRVGGTAGNGNVLYPSTIPLGTPDPAENADVYRFYRTGPQTNTFGSLVAGATYLVRLHFNEEAKTAAASRYFNVDVNGVRKLSNLDVFAEAGGRRIALVKAFTAQADVDGKLAVQFLSVTDQPTISAIEIRQQSGAMTPRPVTSVAAAGQPYLIALSWTRPNQESSYTIWRSETAGGPYGVLASNIVSGTYVDTTPSSGVTYFYRIVGESAGTVVEASQSSEVSAVSNYGTTATGLYAQYYAGFDPQAVSERLAFGEVVPTISTNWGSGPIGAPAVGDRNAKVVWNGNIILSGGSTYTFYAKVRGGFRLWINYRCVINKWNESQPGEWISGTITAPDATGWLQLRAEFYNTAGSAEAALEWASPAIGLARQGVSPRCLRPVALGNPGAWIFRDIDTTTLPGYAGADGGVPGRFWIYAAGQQGIQQHQFIFQKVTGAFELTARVASYDHRSRYGGTWDERMGVAIRSSLAGNQGFAYGLVHDNDNGSHRTIVMSKNDLSVAGAFTETAIKTGRLIPMFLRLTRLRTAGGYQTTAAYSANGVTWTTDNISSIGSSVPTVYVGLSLGVADSELLAGSFDSITLRRLQFPTLLILR
jgi:hypothetical protein